MNTVKPGKRFPAEDRNGTGRRGLPIPWAGIGARLNRQRDIRYDTTPSSALPSDTDDARVPAPGVSGIVLDPTARTVWLPAGVTIDLGGIAKGLYADALAAMLADWPGGCVSAGGDLRVWGDGPTGDGWVVGVEHPGDPERDISRVRMHDEAAATSGTNRRSWRRGDAEAHHLIDPRTGTSADRSLWSVTVVGQTAGLAEVAATALFLSGGDPAALDGFAGRVGPALIVEHDGAVRTIDRREH